MNSIGLAVVAFSSCFLAISDADVGVKFCRKQVRRWDEAVRAVDNAMIEHVDLLDLCRIMVNFTQTAFDTNATCHQRLASRHPTFASFWTHTENNIMGVCYGHSIARFCSAKIPERLKMKCARRIPTLSSATSEQMCAASESFVDCLKEIAVLCRGSPGLITEDVVLSISAMYTATSYMCTAGAGGNASDTNSTSPLDSMQGDAPPGTVSQCAEDDRMVNPNILACEGPNTFAHDRSSCLSKQMRLSCMTRAAQDTCVSLLDDSIIEATRNDYQDSCSRRTRDVELIQKRLRLEEMSLYKLLKSEAKKSLDIDYI